MAESKIKLSIGSVFHDGGFQKANSAVKGLSGTVKNAADGLKAVGGELGAVGGVVGKASDAFGKLSGAMAGGPWGVVAAGVALVVTSLIKWRQNVVEAREAHEKMMRDMRDGYQRRLAESIDGARKLTVAALDATIEKGRAAVERINALAGAYRKLASSESAVINAQNRVSLASIDADVQDASVGATSEQRAEIRANGAVRKVVEENRQKVEAQNIEIAHLTQEYHYVAQQIAEQRKVVEAARKKGEKVREAEEKLADMEKSLTVATNNLKAARTNLVALQLENENAENAARQAAEDVTAANLEKAEATRKETARKKLQADADAKTEKAKADGDKRIAALDRKIEAEKKRQAETERQRKRTASGMAVDQKSHNGLFGGYQYALDAEGNITDFEDFRRAQRYANGRGANDERNAARREARMSERMEGIRRKGRKASAEELRKLAEWDKFQRQKESKEQEQARLKRLQEERDAALKKIKASVETIAKDLKTALAAN